jgi:hypothetical protein
MIQDIANKHGLAIARVASEERKRLSDVVKELLNERGYNISFLAFLDNGIIETYSNIVFGDIDDLCQKLFMLFKTRKDLGKNAITIRRMNSVLVMTSNKYKSVPELQQAVLDKLRKDPGLLDVFDQVYRGQLFTRIEELDING